MAGIHWINPVDGSFGNGADWSGGSVPANSDDALLDPNSPITFTVTSSTSQTVNSVQTAVTGVLFITGGSTFTATNGTGGGANAGSIRVDNNSTFTTGDPLNNSGTITLSSGGNATRLLISAANVALTGGGQVILGDNSQNFITGAVAGDVLTNVDNRISGSGQLGNGQLTLVNQAAGVINANNANNALILNTGAAVVTNAGLIEATGAAGLTILNTTVDDTGGGQILGAGGTVRLQSAQIKGGLLKTTGGGAIVTTDRGSVANGLSSSVTVQGQITIANNTSLTIEGTINNTGTIALQSIGNATDLVIAAAGATLTGGGVVTLTDNSQNFIVGEAAASTLTNVNNTISGSGQLGNGQLTLVNQAAGVINANNAGNALVLNTGAAAVINTGLIEATGAAGLTILNTTVDDSGGGLILAAGAAVRLQSATIIGGTLNSSGGGSIQTADRGSMLDGRSFAVANQGLLTIVNNTSLNIEGTINNTGVIALQSFGNTTDLVVAATGATLTGGGAVTLSDNNANVITGATAGSTLTNVNNIISGAGQFGAGSLTLINQASGVINANDPGNALILNTGSAVVANAGLIEATGAAGLIIHTTTVNDVSGGVILANGAPVYLQSADLIGGTLRTRDGGVIASDDRFSVIDALTSGVTLDGVLKVANNTSLTAQGLLNDIGVLSVASNGNFTQFIVGVGDLTISGAGVVTLSDNGQNFLLGTLSGPAGSQTVTTLTLNSVLSGAGSIGSNLRLVNNSTIDATGANALILATGGGNFAGSNVITNTSGLLESTNPGALNALGGLVLTNVVIANGVGGRLLATGAHTHIDLQSTTIVGGTLQTQNGGVIETVDRGTILDGTTTAVTIQGALSVLNNTSVTAEGTITVHGALDLNSVGNFTELVIANTNVTLNGGGALVLTDNSQNFVVGASATAVLDNVDNTISGAGQLGNGNLTLKNEASGIIDANGVNALVLNTAGQTLINRGLIEATGSGGLSINSTVVDDSVGGVLRAAGSTIRLTSVDVIGGELQATAGGSFATNDRGTLFDGANFAVRVEGQVTIVNNTSLTVQGSVINTSVITLAGVGNFTQLVIANSGATLTGGGHVTLSDNSQNFISAGVNTATLTNVDNVISGAGQLGNGSLTLINQSAGVINANGTNALILNTSGQTVTNHGLIEATGSGGMLINSTTIDDSVGGVILASASTITLQSADIIGGVLQASAGGKFVTDDRGTLLDASTSAITVNGQIAIPNNTSLTISGAIHNNAEIDLQSVGNFTQLVVANSGATLTGGGQVTLSDNSQNFIAAGVGTGTLTNVDNVISGSGQIGNGSLTLVNQAAGVINANGSAGIILNTSGHAVINSGLIEATGAGGLTINNTAVDGSSGGTILASGGNVVLQNSTVIEGGTIKTALGSTFVTADRNSLLDGTASTVHDQATINVQNNTSISIQGAIENTGAIHINSGGNFTELVITSAGAILTGGGQITLSDNSQNFIGGVSASSTLTNVDNTISGSGQFGNGSLTLVNQAAGVINGIGSNALIINTGAVSITNAGLIEATGAGGVTIQSNVVNTGVLEANGGTLTINGAVTGSGFITVAAGAVDIASTYSGNLSFTGATGLIELDHSQTFGGTVFGFSSSGGGTLDTLDLRDISFTNPSEATWSNGVLTVSDGTHTARITLSGDYSATTFKAASDGHGGVAVTILASAPVSAPDSYNDAVGQALTVSAASGLLANDVDPNGLALTAAVLAGAGPTHGSVTVNPDGSFTYTPNAGFSGADTFKYVASDAAGSGTPATVTITVNASTPTSHPDAYSTGLGQPLTVGAAAGVLANDTDPNSLPLTASLAPGAGPKHGSLTLNANGSFTYTPNAGFSGTDSFDYIAGDGVHSGPPTTVTLTVNSTSPHSVADSYTATAGQALSVGAATGVLANDTDPGGLPLTAALAPGGGPSHGSLTLNNDGSFTYTPAAGYVGADSFTYVANDGVSSGAQTVVSLTVAAGAPTGHSDSYADGAGQALTVNAANGVLANDTDPNGLGLTASVAPGGAPAHGSLTLNADGSFTYTPTLGFAGSDSFTYIASDGAAASSPVTVTLSVSATAPHGSSDSYSGAEGQALTVGAAAGVLANDTDPNGLTLTAAVAPGGGPAHGSLTLNSDGSFTYTPTAGYNGPDSFNYVASDSLASSTATVVNLTITPGAPVANADSYAAHAGQTLSVAADAGVLGNDTDPGSLSLTAALAPGGGPAHGSLTLNADGSFAYTTAAGFAGTDSFTYVASDGGASSPPATVTLTVGASAPTSAADSYSGAEGQSLNVAAGSGVLANDTDANGLALSAAVAPGGGPAHGSLTLNSDGSFTYTPNAGFTGTDSFSYLPSDSLSSGTATGVTLTVTAGAPVANADAYSGATGHALTVGAGAGVLANDSDPAGLPLSATLAPGGGPAHGSLSLNADGSFTYTPAAGFAGTDSFTYTAGDSGASSRPATVTLTITASAPSSAADAYAGAEGHTLNVAASAGVLANDTDPNGLTLSATVAPAGGPAHGSLTLNADGSFAYKPDSGFSGTDSFSYIAGDGLASGPATAVTLTVNAGTPTANSDSYSGAAGHTLTVDTGAGVLANDTDPNALSLTASFTPGGGPAHGSVALNADGSFSYTPDAGFAGTDSFSYIAADSSASSAATSVTLNITAASPTGTVDAYAGAEGQTLTVAAAAGVLANDSDPNGLPLSASVPSGGGPAHGSLTFNSDGSFSYTPDAGYFGDDSFNYIPADTLASGAATTVSLTVAPTPPASAPDSYATNAGSALNVGAAAGVLANDTDPNGLTLSATLATGPTHGALTLNADGSFAYVPATGFVGQDTFTYLATDGAASGTPTTVRITVASVGPIAHPDAYTLSAGHAFAVMAAKGLLANDVDPSGLPMSAAEAPGGAPAHGDLVLAADGSFVYTPDAGFTGTDSFSYLATDASGASAPVAVTLTVAPAAPVLAADVYTETAGATLSVDAAHGVLANDTDPNGLPLSAALAPNGGPAHGQVTLNPDGSFVYTPAAHHGGAYVGMDSFTYIARDGAMAGVATTVEIFSGAGHPVVVAGAGVNTLTGADGGNVYQFTNGQIEDPALHGGVFDTITNFAGAGQPFGAGSDYLFLKGFSKTATLTYEHDLPGDSHAHVYLITDGAHHSEIVLDYAGPGVALNHQEYGFFQ